MGKARVVGQFTAGGKSGADIEAAILNESEFPNWDQGHPAKTLYSTNGAKTTDSFDVPVSSGNYVLIFSNRNSMFFTRYVAPQVELKYEKAITQ